MTQPDCKRTVCIVNPGVSVPGMKCTFSYTGSMPNTGALVCMTCGTQKNGG